MNSPAALARPLRDAIRAQRLQVELSLDHRWIFLRRAHFSFRDFGDVTARERELGKWQFLCAADTLITHATKLLGGLHDGPLRLAKFTNLANWPRLEPLISVYAMNADSGVLAHLEALGWLPTWRSNRDTYRDMK